MNSTSNNRKTTRRESAGFTVLEVMAAIFVITVAIGGIAGLIAQSISLTRSTANEAIAWYLAQEGVEIVRNMRDTNMLDPILPWFGDCPSGTGCLEDCEVVNNCGADYNDPSLIDGLNNTPTPLLYDAVTGLYTYDSGTASPFERRIAAYRCNPAGGCLDPGEQKINIDVRVTWQERGVDREVQLLAEVYNWED